uniref:Putative secreted peptide n=1 Tax=Anopheles braziliensis TaxID=58242 RepID=A0A2M3ZSE6_9DIPT
MERHHQDTKLLLLLLPLLATKRHHVAKANHTPPASLLARHCWNAFCPDTHPTHNRHFLLGKRLIRGIKQALTGFVARARAHTSNQARSTCWW